MPTSVLLAVLVAAGLLALAPALVRRYDATERLVAERTSTTARVLRRRRRRRTVPGRTPVNLPLATLSTAADAADRETGPGRAAGRDGEVGPGREMAAGREAVGRAAVAGRRAAASADAAGPAPAPDPAVPRPRDPVDRRRWWQRRRRRVFGVLATLCLVETTAAAVLGPGFLLGLAVSVTLLLWYVTVLRRQVLFDRRDRRRHARVASRYAAQRAAERRLEAERRRRIEEARRAAQAQAREPDAPWWPTPGPVEVPEPRGPGLRGQAYQARAANF